MIQSTIIGEDTTFALFMRVLTEFKPPVYDKDTVVMGDPNRPTVRRDYGGAAAFGEAVLAYLKDKGPKSAYELAEAFGTSPSKVRDRLRSLRDHGKIVSTGKIYNGREQIPGKYSAV